MEREYNNKRTDIYVHIITQIKMYNYVNAA